MRCVWTTEATLRTENVNKHGEEDGAERQIHRVKFDLSHHVSTRVRNEAAVSHHRVGTHDHLQTCNQF